MAVLQQRDHDLTRDRLGEWLGTRMPEAEDLRITDLTLSPAQGYSNELILFATAWSERGGERRQGLVARVKPSGHQVFFEPKFEVEARVMEALSRHTDVPVPRMYGLEEDEGILGAPFFVMERIEGQVPMDVPSYHAEGWVTELAPEQQEKLWWSGLEAMARVHRADWRVLGLGFLDDPVRGRTALEQQLNYYEEYLDWVTGGPRHPSQAMAFAWIRENLPDDEPADLCWGDSRLGNVMFRGSDCVALLDWEMVGLGNPEQDLAWWLFFDRFCSEDLAGGARVPGFPSDEETIARFEELIGRPVRHLELYEVFAPLRLSVIVARITQLAADGEGLPPNDEQVLNNLATQFLTKTLGRKGML